MSSHHITGSAIVPRQVFASLVRTTLRGLPSDDRPSHHTHPRAPLCRRVSPCAACITYLIQGGRPSLWRLLSRWLLCSCSLRCASRHRGGVVCNISKEKVLWLSNHSSCPRRCPNNRTLSACQVNFSEGYWPNVRDPVSNATPCPLFLLSTLLAVPPVPSAFHQWRVWV